MIDSQNESAELYIDGASRGNPGKSGIGIILINGKGDKKEYKRYIGIGTNNQAEYKALIDALETAKKLEIKNLKVFTDSQLVANQINGKWRVKHPEILPLFKKAKVLINFFEKVLIFNIPRVANAEADRLANEAINEYFNNKRVN